MSIVSYYALVALLFSLFSLFRFSMSLGLLERPLVLGLLWGVLTGQWAMSMSIAVFFELAWLDLIPAGSFIPPHLTAATIAALALSTRFSLEVPGEILLAMLASVPLAWVGTRAEAGLRNFNISAFNEAVSWTKGSDDTPFPSSLIIRSVALTAVSSGVGFFVLVIVLHYILWLLLPNIGMMLARLDVTWPHLWLGASLGGLLALRIQRAYMVFAIGAVLVLLIGILPIF